MNKNHTPKPYLGTSPDSDDLSIYKNNHSYEEIFHSHLVAFISTYYIEVYPMLFSFQVYCPLPTFQYNPLKYTSKGNPHNISHFLTHMEILHAQVLHKVIFSSPMPNS